MTRIDVGYVLSRPQDVLMAETLDVEVLEVKGDLLLQQEMTMQLSRIAQRRPGLLLALTSPLPRALGHKLVGPDRGHASALATVERLLRLCSEWGVEVVTFGCSQARAVPPGYSKTLAEKELCNFLQRLADDVLDRYRVQVGVEALKPDETNLVNDVREAVRIVDAVDRPRVGVAYDFFHGDAVGSVPGDDIELMGPRFVHLQLAAAKTRAVPHEDADLPGLRSALTGSSYSGAACLELETSPDAVDLRQGLAFLQDFFRDLG